MAVYYSDHFHGYDDAGAADITTLDPQRRPPSGVNRSRVHYKRAEVAQDLAVDDTVRVMQFNSGDRLLTLELTATDSGSTGAIDIGLAKSGVEHDGAVIDADIFVDNQAVTTAVARTERLASGTPDIYLYRGRTLWEIADQGDGTYTSDPMELWDLLITCKTATDVATTFVLEAYYTSGD